MLKFTLEIHDTSKHEQEKPDSWLNPTMKAFVYYSLSLIKENGEKIYIIKDWHGCSKTTYHSKQVEQVKDLKALIETISKPSLTGLGCLESFLKDHTNDPYATLPWDIETTPQAEWWLNA